MNMNDYQAQAITTFLLRGHKNALMYLGLGIGDEAGEVQGKLKKILRDQDGKMLPENIAEIKKELGDVMWYVANLADELGLSLEEVAKLNIEKLASRAERGKLTGSGDNR